MPLYFREFDNGYSLGHEQALIVFGSEQNTRLRRFIITWSLYCAMPSKVDCGIIVMNVPSAATVLFRIVAALVFLLII